MINNLTFLKAIFGDEHTRAHVTSFDDDPSAIPQERSGICWAGHHYSDRELTGLNQYFTVSLFSGSKRRKLDFVKTHVVMLDDVKEKLDFEQCQRLPEPSFVLETSHGSEQWGYILSIPETVINRVDNLHDGLVSRGLAPNGQDPGQKGVTRFVRLPDGHNTKSSKLVFGKPFKCKLKKWNPTLKYTMADIAAPFNIDLDAARREVALTGATDIDHPIMKHIEINEKLRKGQYDIKCPWINEHTGRANSGTAIFTNEDLSLGFKCHHGHCSDRTAMDVITHFDMLDEINLWKVKDIAQTTDTMIDELQHAIPGKARNDLASEIIKRSINLDPIDKMQAQTVVREVMGWSAGQMKTAVTELTKNILSKADTDFMERFMFVGEQNKFYEPAKGIWYTTDSFANTNLHHDTEAKKNALLGNAKKVDKIDYAPEYPEYFEEDGIQYGNIWRSKTIPRKAGDCSAWLEHFKTLGWDSKHMLQWMAFTLRHPGQKINHAIILGSGEGSGKDWLLTPLKNAMGTDHKTIDGKSLLKDFNSYLIGTKYLHINEVELGDTSEALRVSNSIKPLTCAPPSTLSVNEKSIKEYDIRNIVNLTMTTNSRLPLRLRDMSRRLYCLWSDFSVRDAQGLVMPEWSAYWDKAWRWMNNDGWKYCVDYLMELDLSDFNPGEAPPMTPWLREMVSNSENTVVQTLRSLIDSEITVMAKDKVTTTEIMNVHAYAKKTSPELVYCDRLTPAMINLNMKNMGYRQIGDLWQIRNDGKGMRPNVQLVKQ